MRRTIAIDLRCLTIPEKSERGTGQVVRPLLAGLAEIDTGNRYVLLVHPDQPRPSVPESWEFQAVPWEYGDASRSNWFGESVRMGRFLEKLRPDLYHSPDLYYPRGYSGPVVVTINDYYEFPIVGPFELFGKRYGWRWNLRFRTRYAWTWRSLRRYATRIATISRTTAERIAAGRPELADRIVPIPLGLGEEWRRRPGKPKAVLEKYDLGRPLVLQVGGFENRKNPEGVLAAFRRLRKEEPEATLAMVGPPHGSRRRLSGTKYLGYVPLDELKRLYMTADCLLFPSFEEGFGLPILEALSFGCPVVTSRGTATEETAAGHAELADPRDQDEIFAALLRAIRSGRKEPLSRIRSHADVALEYANLYDGLVKPRPH